MCRWMESHFHNWIDYNGVTFVVELLEWGAHFRDFWGKEILVSKDQFKKYEDSRPKANGSDRVIDGHRIDCNRVGF